MTATLLQQTNGHSKTPEERKRPEIREINAARRQSSPIRDVTGTCRRARLNSTLTANPNYSGWRSGESGATPPRLAMGEIVSVERHPQLSAWRPIRWTSRGVG